mmetsp:Transcript_14983/g.34288  ORF Transcript_14983/g.34288 Transcript_14983/m.34288 type:complete len:337 (-) Transcript_14983:728-1738(-)
MCSVFSLYVRIRSFDASMDSCSFDACIESLGSHPCSYFSFRFIHATVCRPMSSTISSAAYGFPATMAAWLMVWRRVESCNQDVTVSAILEGLLWYSPNRLSKTTSTLPASCPGRKLVIITGRPTAAASAIVPGPAFDTRTSAATMYSGMFVRNPSGMMSTVPFVVVVVVVAPLPPAAAAALASRAAIRFLFRTFPRRPRTPPVRFRALARISSVTASKSLVSSSVWSFSFRPHTTQTVASTPWLLSSAYRLLTMSLRDPTPSPPPMTRTICFSGAMPSSSRTLRWYSFPRAEVRSPPSFSAWTANPCRMGSPVMTMSSWAVPPRRRARSYKRSLAT